MKEYPWTQADKTPELDALANEAGIAQAEAKARAIPARTYPIIGRKVNTAEGVGVVVGLMTLHGERRILVDFGTYNDNPGAPKRLYMFAYDQWCLL